MGYYDDLVAAFLLDQFRMELRQDYADIYVNLRRELDQESREHLRDCDSATVLVHGWSWICHCYSEITRDDVFTTAADVFCDHGNTVAVQFGGSRYIADGTLLEKLEEFEETWNCTVSDERE